MTGAARVLAVEVLAADRDGHERGDIVNAAKSVYIALGDDAAAYALLETEIPNSRTPCFYMSGLASLDEKNDRPALAIDWMIRAHAASTGPATRAQWGESCVSGLIRLAADNVPMIRATALRVVNELDGADALHGRTRVRIDRMLAALEAWANTPERRAAVREVVAAMTTIS